MEMDRQMKLVDGAFYSEEDDESLAQVVVLGAAVRDALFGNDSAVGKSVKMKGQSYKVIGVLGKRGLVAGFNYDELVYLPVQTMQKKILGVDYVRFITVKTTDENRIAETMLDIEDLLRNNHDIDDPSKDDFSVMSIKEAQDLIGKVFGTINILLLALTSISLVVGGVGIMNVMYVAVIERTFEIGLRKAVGAKSGDILKQFLLEAIFITFIGGAIGILLGFLFSFLLSFVFETLGYDLQFVTTWQSILLATGFSAAVGIIFGYYPARKASQLSPMEALRKE
jgi:putative ABC transport system permease protein